MGYLFLALAIVGEVVATSFLKLSSGEKTSWWVYAVVVAGYGFAFTMLAQTLARGVPLGIAYGIWAAVGVVAVAMVSWQFFGESLTLTQIGGIALVAAGVALLEVGGTHK